MLFEPREVKVPENMKSMWDMFVNVKEQVFAQQLTILDWEIFSKIEVEELLDQAWNKEGLSYKAQNVLALIRRKQELEYWVATIILTQTTSKERKKMYEKFINIALELKKINNYHSLMGFVIALEKSSVNRLMKSDGAGKKQMKKIEDMMSANNDYENYRQALIESYNNTAPTPLIPYLGVHLLDLISVEESIDNYLDGPTATIINFNKRELIYCVIEELLKYQQTPYNYKPTEPEHTFLSNLPQLSEKDTQELSSLRDHHKK